MIKISVALFLIFTNNTNALEAYFASIVKDSPRVTFISYKNEVILQHLLNKRYVYTMAKNGKYNLQNGYTVTVKNGLVENIYLPKDADSLASIANPYGAFFNQATPECNYIKFIVAKKMMAQDCNIDFHQYQIIPLYPDFIRVILVGKNDIAGTQRCEPNFYDNQYLLNIESKTDEAIRNEQQVESQKDDEKGYSSEEKDAIKKAQKTINRLKPWEFGLNDRSVIINGIENNKDIGEQKMAFYITYFNDIGCVPYENLKVVSCNEYIKYRGFLMENYIPLSETKDHEKEQTVLEIYNGEVIKYKIKEIQSAVVGLKSCKLEDAVLKR